MKEYIFRGKCKWDGNWVWGSLVILRDWLLKKDVYIIVPAGSTLTSMGVISNFEEVIPETVSQFTGKYDTKGARIFVGDIVSNSNGKTAFVIDARVGRSTEDGKGVFLPEKLEIVGNIHDNPDLLSDSVRKAIRYTFFDSSSDEKRQYIPNTFGVDTDIFKCFATTYPNDYICNQFDGGCPHKDTCHDICTYAGDNEPV